MQQLAFGYHHANDHEVCQRFVSEKVAWKRKFVVLKQMILCVTYKLFHVLAMSSTSSKAKQRMIGAVSEKNCFSRSFVFLERFVPIVCAYTYTS